MSQSIDIGHGVTISLAIYGPDAPHGLADKLGGIQYTHPGSPKPGTRCAGYVPLDGPNAWTLVSREPLTLSPSLLCTACGHHGWIRDGKWVPA